MKLGHIAAAAALLTPLQLTAATQLTEAHIVDLKGTLTVRSCCSFLGQGSDETRDFPFSTRLTVTRAEIRAYREISGCAGGEARGVLQFRIHLNDNNTVSVQPTLLLYEGSSCNSDDLDAQAYPQPTTVPANSGETRWDLYVRNNELHSPDAAWANFGATVSLWP